MGALFTWLFSWLGWLINTFIASVVSLFSTLLDGITYILFILFYILVTILSWIFNISAYLSDFFLTTVISFISTFAGDAGLLSKFGFPTAEYYSWVSAIATYSNNAIYTINTYVQISSILVPIKAYILFLIAWGAYKLVKSWIPTVGA